MSGLRPLIMLAMPRRAPQASKSVRWRVVCSDGAVWDSNLSKQDAELECMAAKACTWCHGPHRVEIDPENTPSDDEIPPEAS